MKKSDASATDLESEQLDLPPKSVIKKIFWLCLLILSIQNFYPLGHIYYLKYFDPTRSSFMSHYLDSCSKEEKCSIKHTNVKFNQISPQLKKAVLIAEDDRFFEHEGLDYDAIEKSLDLNRKKGKVIRGASTITQQVVKNLYLNKKKTYWRKGKEILFALYMEKVLDKKRILELYLNIIEWGPGIYGAESASLYYFHKSADLLNRQEAAFLASIVPNPKYLNSSQGKQRALRRKEIFLKRMSYRQYKELQ